VRPLDDSVNGGGDRASQHWNARCRRSASTVEVISATAAASVSNAAKIESALARAGCATGEFGADAAAAVTAQVIKVIAHRYPGSAPAIGRHPDIVEAGADRGRLHADARAYIVYASSTSSCAPTARR